MKGTKHTIECHCVLPQYRNRKDILYHKFVAFSIIDDSDTVLPKYAQCNNCGVVHKIYDICKSEIIQGKDEISTLCTIDDISLTIPEDIRNILESYQVDLPTWEQVQFTLQNKQWGEHIILRKEIIDDEIQGKMLIIDGLEHGKIRIESFLRNLYVGGVHG
jgi:hypothetical protein